MDFGSYNRDIIVISRAYCITY